MEDKNWLIVGRFGRPHGVKGLISVHSFTEPKNNLTLYPRWFRKHNDQYVLIKHVVISVNDKNLLVSVEGFEDRDKVATLTNSEIVIESHYLPELDDTEFYWHELMGMTVVNTENYVFGNVINLLPTGANDVLVIREIDTEKLHYIPFVLDRYVLSVSREQKQIIVDWQEDYL